MKLFARPMGLIVFGGLCAMGCAPSAPPPAPAAATTTPAISAPNATAKPETPVASAVAAKDMTHVVAQDEPFYDSAPAVGAAPTGTFKGGTKVLMMIPGFPYSKVEGDDGKAVYTLTAGLKPLGK